MRSLATLACAGLILSACGSTPSDDDTMTVVASFYPVGFVAERVGGDLATVDTLTTPGVDAHDLELAPRQVASVQDADLVVYQAGFQAAVDDAVEQADRDPETVVDAMEGVDAIAAEEGDDHDHEGEEGHDHAEEEGHDDHADEEGHEGHDHGPNDPHVWLDPANMMSLAEETAAAMSAADPDNAETYEANAEELVAELQQLDEDLTAGLEQCSTRDIVVSHAAFGYLARAYDLNQVPIAGIDPSNEPSAAQLAQLSDLVEEDGITTIFTERLASSVVADTLASEAGVETAVLDPIEGLSDETTDEDYLSIMQENLDTLVQANDCL